MLIFRKDDKAVSEEHGGYSRGGAPVKDTYVQIDGMIRGILYEPAAKGKKSEIGIVILHSDSDYSTRPIGGELAKRGYTAFCGCVSNPLHTLDEKLLDVNRVVSCLKNYGCEKIVLMGHSGGATLMSAYQAVAENGAGVFQGDNFVYPCAVREKLHPADGVMLLDANWGNGAMTLLSTDPAVVEDENKVKIDPALDIFNPDNGFLPDGTHYSAEFIAQFFTAQKERSNKIIKKAVERLYAIEHGHSFYTDDEPFIVPGGAQGAPCNKMVPQDISLLSHTKRAYPLLHKDNRVTNEIIYSRRRPECFFPTARLYGEGCLVSTVRCFLSERAILAADGYTVKADGIYGINWNSGYSCGVGNVQHFHAPLLCMGMSAGYEFMAAEEIFSHAVSEDKTIAFVEGATHVFYVDPETEKYPGEFGDTQETLYNYVDSWLCEPGRFIQ